MFYLATNYITRYDNILIIFFLNCVLFTKKYNQIIFLNDNMLIILSYNLKQKS